MLRFAHLRTLAVVVLAAGLLAAPAAPALAADHAAPTFVERVTARLVGLLGQLAGIDGLSPQLLEHAAAGTGDDPDAPTGFTPQAEPKDEEGTGEGPFIDPNGISLR